LLDGARTTAGQSGNGRLNDQSAPVADRQPARASPRSAAGGVSDLARVDGNQQPVVAGATKGTGTARATAPRAVSSDADPGRRFQRTRPTPPATAVGERVLFLRAELVRSERVSKVTWLGLNGDLAARAPPSTERSEEHDRRAGRVRSASLPVRAYNRRPSHQNFGGLDRHPQGQVCGAWGCRGRETEKKFHSSPRTRRRVFRFVRFPLIRPLRRRSAGLWFGPEGVRFPRPFFPPFAPTTTCLACGPAHRGGLVTSRCRRILFFQKHGHPVSSALHMCPATALCRETFQHSLVAGCFFFQKRVSRFPPARVRPYALHQSCVQIRLLPNGTGTLFR